MRHLKATSCVVEHNEGVVVVERRSDKIDPRGTLGHSIDVANESRTVNTLRKRRPLGQRRVKLDADVAQLILEREQLWSGGEAPEVDVFETGDIGDLRQPVPGLTTSVAAYQRGCQTVDGQTSAHEDGGTEPKGVQLTIIRWHW